MSLRDDFEKLFPVPHPAKWSEHLGCYSPEYQSDPALANLAVRVANSHNVLWQGFQAGYAAGLEAAAAECDKQEKSLYSTLNGNSDAIPSSIGAGICAEAIRAMKP